jgi:hypothetical protein
MELRRAHPHRFAGGEGLFAEGTEMAKKSKSKRKSPRRKDGLWAFTKAQLLDKARAAGLDVKTRMTKGEIVAMIERAAAPQVSAAARPSAPSSPGGRPPASRRAEAAPAKERPVYIDRGPELPRHYGRDILVAMVRDPNWIFAYWELEGPSRQRIADEAGRDALTRGQWVLRIHNADADAPEDHPVILEAGNWYLRVPDDATLVLEIGLQTPDGEFIGVLKSNRVSTPRLGYSDEVDEEWMIVEEDFRKLLELSGGPAATLAGSRSMPEEVLERWRRALGVSSAAVPGSRPFSGSGSAGRKTKS